MSNSVAVFTGKNIEWIQKEGGSGYWIAQTGRIKAAEYVICIRNHRETWAIKNDGVSHGQAFLIGKISDCVRTEIHKGRKVIQMSEYALLPTDDNNFKGAWKKLTDGQRYPVAYLKTEDLLKLLNLDVSSLDWRKFKANEQSAEIETEESVPTETDDAKDLSDIISEAKEMVAHAAGVDAGKVSIQIHF
ncbi:MAG: hypothetical protein ACXVA2_25005 [Mucilaginibacter sp.]